MALTILRHPRPDVGDGICYGQLDVPLADGWQDAIDQMLSTLGAVDHITSSPLRRCRETSEYIGARLGREITIDADLAEIDFGRWEGIAWDDIPRHEIDVWAADFQGAKPHGGESVRDLRNRVERTYSRLSDGHTLWITHAGVYRAALSLAGHPDPWNAKLDYTTTAKITLPSR